MRPASLLGALVFAALAIGTAQAEPNQPCHAQQFEGSAFLVCPVDTRQETIRLVLNDKTGIPLRGFAALSDTLGADRKHVRFAMNAGMFDERGMPIGLLIASEDLLHAINLAHGSGNFYLQPNGVFWMDASGALHIDRSNEISHAYGRPMFATQSGPLLLNKGAIHPQISMDGTSTYTRNAVGLRNSHTAVFVISDDPVSFGRLARFFRDALGCRDALYLDGAISSIWVPSTGRLDHDHPLGPMIVVLDKKS
jgi:uncharacterized protein YigE (DUF2233 family)